MPAEAIILFAIALFALGLGIKNVYNRKRINNTVNFITGIGLIAVGITTLVGTIILLIASKKWWKEGKERHRKTDIFNHTIILAEMKFDAWCEDKGEHTGGIPQCMLRMSRIPQATKQGAKGVRPPSREEKNHDGNGNRVKKTKGSNTTYYYGDAYEKRNTVGISEGANRGRWWYIDI
jgi:hypothetical protein